MDKITVRIDKVYGNKTVYPVCEKAQWFANLAGTRTLTEQAIGLIKKLGYMIEVMNPQPITL